MICNLKSLMIACKYFIRTATPCNQNETSHTHREVIPFFKAKAALIAVRINWSSSNFSVETTDGESYFKTSIAGIRFQVVRKIG
jgi:hypothetical protein